ncbi:MAG: rod shape-determining protein MreC [Sedimentisphaerales bacterium]|nr:rod shape-determining protein MreC [Sedimentisphaerales bacterium]
MLFTWFMLGGLIFLFAPPRVTGKLQLAYTRLFRWPLARSRSLTIAARPLPQPDRLGAPDYDKVIVAQRQLRNHVANLEAQLEEAHNKIDRLARLRTIPQWNRMGFLLAEIITVTGQAQNELFVDRGTEDGVAPGQFVLADNSIIGTVSDTGAQTSKIKLITDPTSKIPVYIGATNVPGVMEGRGGNVARIPLVSAATYQIRKGDLVYAKKTPGLLAVPVIAAKVTQCKIDAAEPLLWDITVQPVCDITKLANVAVVMAAPIPK